MWLKILNYQCGRIGVLFFKAKTLCNSFVIGARSITVDVTYLQTNNMNLQMLIKKFGAWNSTKTSPVLNCTK